MTYLFKLYFLKANVFDFVLKVGNIPHEFEATFTKRSVHRD